MHIIVFLEKLVERSVEQITSPTLLNNLYIYIDQINVYFFIYATTFIFYLLLTLNSILNHSFLGVSISDS